MKTFYAKNRRDFGMKSLFGGSKMEFQNDIFLFRNSLAEKLILATGYRGLSDPTSDLTESSRLESAHLNP